MGFMASHWGRLTGIECGRYCSWTLWLKCLPSGPATPEPEGRGWVVNSATVSKSTNSTKPQRRQGRMFSPLLALRAGEAKGLFELEIRKQTVLWYAVGDSCSPFRG